MTNVISPLNKKLTMLPEGYKPSDKEEYMNPTMLQYFKLKLEDIKYQLLSDSNETLEHLREKNLYESDINERAAIEVSTAFELRTRNRYFKLLNKIENALNDIESGQYGYCEETDEEIGIKRLEAKPFATLCIEAQEKHEKNERLYSDQEKNERLYNNNKKNENSYSDQETNERSSYSED